MVVIDANAVNCQTTVVVILHTALVAGVAVVSARQLVDLAIIAKSELALVSILEVNKVFR